MTRFFNAVGGRKQANAYIAVLLIVGYAIALFIRKDPPSFIEFASAIGGLLVGHNITVAYEDTQKHRGAQ